MRAANSADSRFKNMADDGPLIQVRKRGEEVLYRDRQSANDNFLSLSLSV